MNRVTVILNAIERGEGRSEDLLPLVYDELRRLAGQHMRQERAGHSLQPTALVHEAYLRLVGDGDVTWQNRRHFFGAAAIAMQRILVERARQRQQLKRGGDLQQVQSGLADLVAEDSPEKIDLIALDAALLEFQATEPLKAELVRLRFFAGLSEDEASQTLGISRATASRWWAFARAWLYSKMQNGAAES
ncbi:MAG: RNA polymerase subunit sigma [Planctomycetaceae bacterium]|nr:RNA polymerase subunit sigma [Planctomycetaceae bacterium]